MKHGNIKKLLALLLALCMLGALPLGATAATTAKADPVIFIPDMMKIVLYQDPDSLNNERVIFDPQGTKMTQFATDVVAGLLSANMDEAKGAAKISSAINELFYPIRCDEYGNSMNLRLGVRRYYSPVSHNTTEPIYTDNVAAFIKASQLLISSNELFVFQYDWRLAPTENAALLRDYIARVKQNTGKSKVSLVSGGYGGVVANGYLYAYPNEAARDLRSCIFLDSLAEGSSIIGDVMSGDLIRTVSDALHDLDSIFDLQDVYDTLQGEDVGDAFARYINSDPTGMLAGALRNMVGTGAYSDIIAALALSLASFIIQDEGMFTKVGSGYREIIMKSDEHIYDAGLREYMRNMPGLWAVVPEDSYQQAMAFMFGVNPQITDELKEKIDGGRDILESTEHTLKQAQINGINVCVVAGYGLQILPITSSILEQSDGLQATRYAGIGATTGDMKHDLKKAQQCGNGRHDHVAPGREVDAATCYLPENTWFIKSHEHMHYESDTAAAFVVWLTLSNTQRNIWQSVLYPQYLQKSKLGDKISALSDPNGVDNNEYMYGDLDIDGRVDAADARLALRYAVGLQGTPTRTMTQIGDVDGNGQIDAADARLILRYSVGLERTFAAAR